ncbi:glycerophosphodiester phosphodiesterase family protein [Mucilaginibacter sabulilitoris]|uniref:Glycerophosphodiester phosphodiesterase family protein n=1 Tax=Mucilaginibacter sabulilitoris TaxID=1173583 RepID=A0ABZ0TI57_9SPHI|nr:glycerophosphodiester phosphodiesterase family protein [Mucilaginibacter sabulilitoris]WPU92713.1 glycerophosphodiester phosphodiesterase family protein [Mucilaginibacter sabulilitoris]
MKRSVKYYAGILILLPVAFVAVLGFKAADKFYTFKLHNAKDVKEFFKYTPDAVPFISAHRGGARKGYPENCIATFENTLSHVHSLLEMDPHYTKDSDIVVMHDATLDRTSNGTGKIADHTLKEVKSYKLKDVDGNLTNYQIPTLDEVLEWAKGKTILVMDMKELSMEARVKKVQEHKAYASTIIMAYTIADAQKCYKLDKNIVMEVMLNSVEKVKEFDNSGVPWQNVIVFVSQKPVTDPTVFNEIHKRGAMCMEGAAFSYDAAYTKGNISIEELNKDYKSIIAAGADVIEANLAIEAGTAIHDLQQAKMASSSKAKFF